jgi:hypothetical protein
MITLPVEADDKHWPPMPITVRLTGFKNRSFVALRGNIPDALPKTTMAEPIRAAKEIDAIVGIVWSQSWFHGAKVLIAKGQ